MVARGEGGVVKKHPTATPRRRWPVVSHGDHKVLRETLDRRWFCFRADRTCQIGLSGEVEASWTVDGTSIRHRDARGRCGSAQRERVLINRTAAPAGFVFGARTSGSWKSSPIASIRALKI